MPWGVAKKIENFLNLKIKIIIDYQIIFKRSVVVFFFFIHTFLE